MKATFRQFSRFADTLLVWTPCTLLTSLPLCRWVTPVLQFRTAVLSELPQEASSSESCTATAGPHPCLLAVLPGTGSATAIPSVFFLERCRAIVFFGLFDYCLAFLAPSLFLFAPPISHGYAPLALDVYVVGCTSTPIIYLHYWFNKNTCGTRYLQSWLKAAVQFDVQILARECLGK